MANTCPLPLPRLCAVLLAVVLTPAIHQAQPPPSRSSLGLRAIGSLAVHAGYTLVERGAEALEAGGTLDLGHFSSRRMRLAADVAFLRTLPYTEFVVQDDMTYRDVFYDLNGHVVLGLLARDPVHRVVPYVSFGVGVHILTSSFGSIPIDARYNTNNFGLKAAGGLRIRTGSSGRLAMLLEGSATLARDVSRRTIRAGGEVLFGDLIRR